MNKASFLFTALLSASGLAPAAQAECPSSFSKQVHKTITRAYRCNEITESANNAAYIVKKADVCLTTGPVQDDAVSTYGKNEVAVVTGQVDLPEVANLTRIYWGNRGFLSKYRTQTSISDRKIYLRDGKSPDVWDSRSHYEIYTFNPKSMTLNYYRWGSVKGLIFDFSLKCTKL